MLYLKLNYKRQKLQKQYSLHYVIILCMHNDDFISDSCAKLYAWIMYVKKIGNNIR
jgi:hypothetical protein